MGNGYLDRVAGENGSGDRPSIDLSGAEDIVITQPAIKKGLMQLNETSNAELREHDDESQ